MRIKLLLSYDGTQYGGWQKQKDSKPTIQGSLEEALSKILNQPINTIGSGRTDAGVHATGQVVHFDTSSWPKGLQLVKALNSLTPNDIVTKMAWEAPADFHALASAEEKTYKYFIHNSPVPTALKHRFTAWVRHPLDIHQLNALSAPLLGEHDFKSFQTSGTDVPNTVRNILDLNWEKKERHTVVFTIRGNGFLKQMVRNIVGTLLDLHKRGESPQRLLEILAAQDRSKALSTAPANGLFLCHVKYPRALDNKCRKI